MDLQGEVRCDSWGKVGESSQAGVFYWNSRKRYMLDQKEKYSTAKINALLHGGTTFSKDGSSFYWFIKQQPQAVGTKCAKMFGNRLPFQIRIMSLLKCMSLACHPNKVTINHGNRVTRFIICIESIHYMSRSKQKGFTKPIQRGI